MALSRITRPLSRLATAADRLGRGEDVAMLHETDPEEVRELTEAFNRMQARLTRFVSDRTPLLAALGHDLRSPLTAMRIRAEMIEGDETRERLIATIAEMQEMVEATLAFARGDAQPHLLQNVCAELAEPGEVPRLEAAPHASRRRARPLNVVEARAA